MFSYFERTAIIGSAREIRDRGSGVRELNELQIFF